MKIVDGIIAVIYVIAMAVLFFLRDCEKDLPMGILALAVTVAAVVVMVIQNKKPPGQCRRYGTNRLHR